ncbi:MAG: hypothetical protein ACI9U2_000535 [Bradymonadia bacterium]|jgi:hypothetical protein
MSRRRRKPRRVLSAADVLSGTHTPALAELIDLIHRINPTERGLSAHRTAARYATKSALQSLLVERFADRLSAVAHGGPRTVSLRVPSLASDAGHAALDALSPKARAWCQRRIDERSFAPADAPPAAVIHAESDHRDSAVGADLARGRAALDAYDFDAAEVAFRAARVRDPDDLAPVMALMALWIDTLMADAEALAFFDGLGALGERSEVQALTAVAAARLGRADRAERLLVNRVGERAAEAWGWLAQAALRAGDLAQTRRALSAARQAAPSHPLTATEDALEALAVQRRAPAEAALLAMVDEAPWDRVEAQARRLRADHPGSEVSGRVLRAIAIQRRDAECEAALVHAAEAELAGRPGAAVTWLRAALRHGADAHDALARAEAAAEEQRRQARLARIEAGLEAGSHEAMLAWLALDDADRAALDPDRPEAAWLVQLAPSRTGAGAKAAVRAVEALARARALLTSAPATALALVEPHRAILAALPDAARLIALSDEAVNLGRAARQRALIDAGAALADAGQWVGALERLAHVGVLEGLLLDAAGQVRQRAEGGLRVEALEAALGPTANLCERRRLLGELVALSPTQAPRLVEADRAVARAFARQIYLVDQPTDARFPTLVEGDAPFWLTAEGDAIVPDLLAGWLFIRWIRGARVRRAVRWRVDASGLLDFMVEGHRLRALLDDGRVFTFDALGQHVLRVDPLAAEPASAGCLLGEHAWLLGARLEIHAVLRRQRVAVHPRPDRLVRVGANVAVFTNDTSRLLMADGTAVGHLATGAHDAVQGTSGVLGVGGTGAVDDQGLRDGHAAGEFQLRANLLWAGPLTWSLSVPAGSRLLRRCAGPEVAILLPDPLGLRCLALQATAPPAVEFNSIWAPSEAVQPWRLTLGDALAERRFSLLLDASSALSKTTPEAWLATARPTHGPWADAVCHHVLRTRDPVVAERIALAALRAWPVSGLVGLIVAEAAARAGRWVAVTHALDGRAPEAGLEQRFFRLLGFARLHAGAPQAALDAWHAAIKVAPTAELERLVAAVSPGLEHGPIDAAPSVFAACMRALRQADAARCVGDLAGVAAALDHPFAWHFNEVQTLARLGEALLALVDGDPLRRDWGLAGVAEWLARQIAPQLRIELPMAGGRWSVGRIDAVAARARAHLDQPRGHLD